MQPLQKCGFILLACFICILILADKFSGSPRKLSSTTPINTILADMFSGSPRKLNSTTPINTLLPSYFNYNNNSIDINLNDTIVHPRSFKETFLAFPWADFENVTAENLTMKINFYSKLFIDELTYFLELEPLVPINKECNPPPFPSPSEINCSQYPKAFLGIKRSQPVKVGVLLQFGFDVDVLEIHMNELYGVVDKFFIIESTHAHYGHIKKPLMWEHVQQQERFKKFPVVHFIVDDAESVKVTNKEWAMESLQERLRWLKFLEWNAATQYFSDLDIIGFGDADEIPSRARLNMFKYCVTRENSVDFGIWFPFGHINQTFRSDFPGHPFTLGDPTYYTLASAKKLVNGKPNEYPTRRRGRSMNYMLGGIHMTHYGYLPFQLVKRVTASEGGLRTLKDLQKLSNYLKNGDVRSMEVDLAATPKLHMRKTIKVDLTNPEMKEICILPWFYDCNRKRYPVWEDGHDTRLD